MDDLLLVLNLGLKSVRSIIFNWRGEKLAQSSIPIETNLKGERVEQNPAEWWAKASITIEQVLSHRDLGKRVRFLTVTSSSSCLVPVDESLTHHYPAIMVSDRRAEQQASRLAALDAFSAVKKATGLGSNSSLMLPKIMWLKEEEPEKYTLCRYFLSPNDYLIGCLTGKVLTDYFNAQKFHFDAVSKTYPSSLLASLEISEDRLPEPAPPGRVVGPVIPEVASQLGLDPDVKVVLSTYDAICAFFGSGASEPNDACDVSGTVSSLRVLSSENVHDQTGRILTTPLTDEDCYIVGGSNNLGGGLIEWMKQALYKLDEFPYQAMEEEAKGSDLGAKGLIFLPYLMGERAPVWDVDARGVFFGLERYHDRGDMTRAVFESTAFSIHHLMDAIEETGVKIGRIRVSGGLTKIPYIQSLKADITGREIAVVDEFESTSLGAAMFVGRGIGVFPDIATASTLAHVRQIIYPDKERHALYQHYYQLYRETYEVLRPLFKKRKAMLDNILPRVETKVANL